MQIVLHKTNLVRELQLVQAIVERKNSIPILSNVLLETGEGEIRIAATDLDVSVRTVCPAEVKARGSVTLGAKKLYEIARSLPDEDVRLRVKEDSWTTIECGEVNFRVAGLPKEDFPSLPEPSTAVGVELPSSALKALIQRTQFAITAEDARYYLAGALLLLEPNSLAMVATDGHRLAFARSQTQLDIQTARRILVPRKAIVELGHLLDESPSVVLHDVENHLLFTVGDRLLASKLIEGQFPAFEKVIESKGDKSVSIERDRLAAAVRRVSLLSSERNRGIKLALSEGHLDLSSSSPDLGDARESLPVEYVGADVAIGFNAQYILDFCGAVEGDRVVVELKDSDSQGVLRPAGDSEIDYRYIVMPMRF